MKIVISVGSHGVDYALIKVSPEQVDLLIKYADYLKKSPFGSAVVKGSDILLIEGTPNEGIDAIDQAFVDADRGAFGLMKIDVKAAFFRDLEVGNDIDLVVTENYEIFVQSMEEDEEFVSSRVSLSVLKSQLA